VKEEVAQFINLYRLRLTLTTTSFNIQKFCVLPTMHLYILRGSHNKTAIISLYSIN